MSESKFEEFPYGELGIIVMKNIEGLAKEVGELLTKKNGTTQGYLLKITEPRFGNGEGKVTIDESVRDHDILIISDVGNYGLKYNMFGEQTIIGPGEHFQDIRRVISTANGRASRINATMPLLYSSRQYRRRSRKSLDYAVASQESESIGVDGICTLGMHGPSAQNAIPLMTFENIYPIAEMVNHFLEKEEIAIDKLDKKDMIIISSDTGTMDRVIYYSNILKQDIDLFCKRRDCTKVVDSKNPIIEYKYIGREVGGKDILTADDMTASGGSVIDIAKQLKKRNAKRIFCAISFVLFTEDSNEFNQVYDEGSINGVCSINLTYVPESIRNEEWFHAVNMSELMGEFIHHINREKPISILLDRARGVSIL